MAQQLTRSSPASQKVESQVNGAGSDLQPVGRPMELHKVVFRVETVNNHTLFNPWIVIDETRNFIFQAKEKKAYMTQQCRIIVKGAKHFPLQLAAGPTTDALYHTWQYCQLLDKEAIPKELGYEGVAKWVKNHVQELFDNARQQVDGGPSSISPLSETDDDLDDDDQLPRELLSQQAQPNSNSVSKSAPAQPTSSLVDRSFFSFFRLSKRPKNKEEWMRRAEIQLQVKRNRRLFAMLFVFLYTLLMRILSFDGYILLLIIFEGFTYVMFTFYREISMHMAKKAAHSRVDKAKDWFRFAIGRKVSDDPDVES